MEELHETPSVVMYAIVITLLLIIGLSLAVFAINATTVVKKWNNLCLLEVGKEYGKYGFSYYIPIDMQPGEYINDTTYMAYLQPDYGNDVPKPKNAVKYGYGYYVPYRWADPGEVQLVSNNYSAQPYPNGVPNGFYPPLNRECPSLGYLNYLSSGSWGYSTMITQGGLLYYLSVVPISVKTSDDKNPVLETLATKNIVFIKFYPGDHFGQAKMQRIGVIQIGKTPNNVSDYLSWLYQNPGYTADSSAWNKNYIIWFGENGEPTIVYPKKSQ